MPERDLRIMTRPVTIVQGIHESDWWHVRANSHLENECAILRIRM